MAGGWHGLRAAGRIARRDAARSRGRTALVAAMIGVPVLVGSAGAVLVASGTPTNATFARWALGDEAQALVVSAAEGTGLHQDARSFSSVSDGGTVKPPSLTGYERSLRRALPAGDALVRVSTGETRVETADVHTTTQTIEYPAAELARLSTAEVLRGALPTRPGEVALSAGVARELGAGVGDTVTITTDDLDGRPVARTARPVRVVGVLAPRNPYLVEGAVAATGTALPAPAATILTEHPAPDDPAAGLPSTTVSWFVTGPTPVAWADVEKVNAVGSRIVSREVVEHPGSAPRAEDLGPYVPSSHSGAVALVAAIAAMALVEAVLLIGPAFAVGAKRAERQLALVAATGGDRRALRRLVLAGGLVIGLGASVAAAALGLGVAVAWRAVTLAQHSARFPDLRVPWLQLALAVVLGAGVAVAAAWVPARRAARVDVAAALAGRRAEARPRRAVPAVGVVLFVVGGLVAVYGATQSRSVVLVAGVLVLELGMVAASGGLVSLVSRLAPVAGVAGRFALRDAARQRGRTAPAVAAVIAAIAGVCAASVYVAGLDVHERESNPQAFAPGLAVVRLDTPQAAAGPDAPDHAGAARPGVDRAIDVLRASLPVSAAYPVRLATPDVHPTAAQRADGSFNWASVYAVRAPGTACPVTGDESRSRARKLSADPRCTESYWGGAPQYWYDSLTGSQLIVDDGTLAAHSGTPRAATAAAALRAGKVVVGSRYLLWPDGTAHLRVPTGPDDGDHHDVAVPAVLVDGAGPWLGNAILPPAAAKKLGLHVEVAGALVAFAQPPTPAQQSTAADALGQEAPAASWFLITPVGGSRALVLLVLVVAAIVVGLGSTAIAVALAGAESRPDLATLGAVGASPSVRRRVAGAQAGVVTVLGTSLGVLTGIALGYVLVVARRYTDNDQFDPFWHFVPPWPALAAILVGVPVVAMAAAALLTRSRLPMVRRVVG